MLQDQRQHLQEVATLQTAANRKQLSAMACCRHKPSRTGLWQRGRALCRLAAKHEIVIYESLCRLALMYSVVTEHGTCSLVSVAVGV